ncbi:unnamed protein product [Closterium sp. NIES-53]
MEVVEFVEVVVVVEVVEVVEVMVVGEIVVVVVVVVVVEVVEVVVVMVVVEVVVIVEGAAQPSRAAPPTEPRRSAEPRRPTEPHCPALLQLLEVLMVLEVLLVLVLLELLEVLLVLLVLLVLEGLLVLELLELLEVLLVLELLELLEVLLELLAVLLELEVLLVLELLEVVLGLELQTTSPLPGPSPYYGPTRGLTERHEPESRPVSPESRSTSPVRTVRAGRVSRPRPPPVPGTHSMTLRPSTAPQRVPLPYPPASSLPAGPDSASDSLRAASPAVMHFLAIAVTDPLFESTTASALVTELVDFAAACCLDYAASLVAESSSASVCPPSIGGECALGTDVLEDRHEEFECFAATVPHLVSMLLAPEGDLDAPDIPTPRSYAEAIEGPYSSQWQAAMDAEMASWKSTGTYVDEVPPPGANIVSGMWIFRVKRPPGSPRAFKARYVARGFSQRQGVDFFQTFSPTPKMTSLRVLLHVAAQRDYKLHLLDFSIAFLQGSLHEEIWLRRPPRFTGSFPAGTQWSLRRPVYGLRQAPREWHDTRRTTLAVLDNLVFATADTEALAHAKSELQKRHTCTDLGELTSYLGLRITRDRAQGTITLTQSHMVQQVLQRFGFTYSSPQSTPLPTGHSLSDPPSDESVEPSGPYPELVGCLISSCEPEIYASAMAAQELRWLTYLLTDLGEVPRSPPVLYVDIKAMLALCQEHRLEHRTKHIALRYFLARELQQRGQLRLAHVASQANTADVFTKALQPCDHQPCFAFLDWSCDLLFSPT